MTQMDKDERFIKTVRLKIKILVQREQILSDTYYILGMMKGVFHIFDSILEKLDVDLILCCQI
jgi:hypothetical protein